MPDLLIVAVAGPAAGTEYTGLSVRNVGGETCEVQGSPETAIASVDGRILLRTGAGNPGLSPPVVLIPGSWAFASPGPVGSSTDTPHLGCMALRLGGETAVVAINDGSITGDNGDLGPPRRCPTGSPTVVASAPPAMDSFHPEPKQRPLYDVRAALDVPPTAIVGSTMIYRVRLTNADLSLIPVSDGVCPLYQQGWRGSAQSVQVLNCPVNTDRNVLGPAIKPGGDATFEMELFVPRTLPPGPAVLEWQMHEYDGPLVEAVVTIVE